MRRAEALGFTGGVRMLIDGRAVWSAGYGLANRETGVRIGPDTLFSTGSNAKQFTAAAILRLEEMGRLRTSDRIGKYLPAVPPDKRNISIHHLLTHTAGFPHDVGELDDRPARDEAARIILSAPLKHPPGQNYSYSNVGYVLAAIIVEKASGTSFESFLRTRLLQPAGLRRTGMVQGDFSQRALGYTFTGPLDAEYSWTADGPSWLVRGAGAMWTTLEDETRWAEALRRGRILSPASRAKLFTPHARQRNSSGEKTKSVAYYGYGWGIDQGAGGSCVVNHDGSGGIHSNRLSISPAHRSVLAFFVTQTRSEWRGLYYPIIAMLNGGPIVQLPAVSKRAVEPHRYVGTYRLANGDIIQVKNQWGRLVVPMRDAGAIRAFSPWAPAELAVASSVGDVRAIVAERITGLSNNRPVVEGLPTEIDPKEEESYWLRTWPEWVGRHGAYKGHQILGTLVHDRRPRTLVQIQFERGSELVGFVHYPEGRVYIDVSPRSPELALAPSDDGRSDFIAYDPETKRVIQVRFANDQLIVRNGNQVLTGRRTD